MSESHDGVEIPEKYEDLGREVGALVDEKQRAYGNSFGKAGQFLRILFPVGIQPEQYGDALALVRIFDKCMRIATDKDALGESPFKDIAGYGLLGDMEHRREREFELKQREIAERNEALVRKTAAFSGVTIKVPNFADLGELLARAVKRSMQPIKEPISEEERTP